MAVILLAFFGRITESRREKRVRARTSMHMQGP